MSVTVTPDPIEHEAPVAPRPRDALRSRAWPGAGKHKGATGVLRGEKDVIHEQATVSGGAGMLYLAEPKR